ncbi:MAG: hypothetical protein ABIJ92_02070 [Candidatus Aenigmatarchaeota archaeon]
MKKSGSPQFNEIVVCKILKIHPNSAIANLVEYNKTGLIQVSEVASKWVRNIRDFLKENQYVVCKVMGVDKDGINLSIKRVHKEQVNSKLNEFKRERKAEKMLEIIAKKMNKTLDQAYDEIGYDLQDGFGSLTKAFEMAVKNPDLLKTKKIKSEWLSFIEEVAKKNRGSKTYIVTSILNIVCYKPNGINIIKDVLSKIKDDELTIKYVSAPRYTLQGTGGNYKEIEAKVTEVSKNIVRDINKNGGEASFELAE